LIEVNRRHQKLKANRKGLKESQTQSANGDWGSVNADVDYGAVNVRDCR